MAAQTLRYKLGMTGVSLNDERKLKEGNRLQRCHKLADPIMTDGFRSVKRIRIR